MFTKATVFGTGAMGTVMAQVLAANGLQVALLATRPERVQELLISKENTRYLPGVHLAASVRPTADARAALAHTELIISALPTQYLRKGLAAIQPHIPPGVPVCSVTKGIELDTWKRPSDVLREFVPRSPVAVLSGPSIAPELAKCLPTTVVIACADGDVARTMQESLSTSWFRVYTNNDIIGVELAGALKNVIALAAGILDGLRAGDNAKAALVTRGLVEITRLGVAMGGRRETFIGLAGVGDLVTTCTSPHGRNRSAGERIGSGVSVEDVMRESASVIEGIPTTRAALALATERGIEMPITEAVSRVLFDGTAPLDAITSLMQRPLRSEGNY